MKLVHPRKARKRTKAARALRFANIQVGDQLMRREVSRWSTYAKDPNAANDPAIIQHEKDSGYSYAVVTDLWFDPVKGETDPISGQMVAIRWLRQGKEVGSKQPHTRRGLAMQGYHFADRDEIAHWDAVRKAIADGDVVGIGRGKAIRKRPKVPGGGL